MWRPQVYLALAACVSLLLLVDGHVSKSLPWMFRDRAAQAIVINLLLFSIVGSTYLSLRCSLRHKRHHLANLLIIVFCLGAVVFLSRAYLDASRVVTSLLTESCKGDATTLTSMTMASETALHGETPDLRRNMARVLARILGLQAAYSDEQGSLVLYVPTEDDKAEFASLDESRRAAREALLKIEATLSSVPANGQRLVLLAAGWLLLFFVGDLARDAWLRSRGKQAR